MTCRSESAAPVDELAARRSQRIARLVAERDTDRGMVTWTIYDHPSDFPDTFVARRFEGGTATPIYLTCRSVDALRSIFDIAGYFHVPRHADDDPVITETWL